MAPDTKPVESPGHWNYGSDNRKPLDPSLYDEHWYKRPMPVVAATQSRWWRLVAFLRRGMPLAQEVDGNTMTTDTRPFTLTHREERDAILHQRYLDYLVRFERWNKPKGWARYMVRHPLAALAALATLTRGRELPPEWCHRPLSEVDFQIEILVDSVRRMSQS